MCVVSTGCVDSYASRFLKSLCCTTPPVKPGPLMNLPALPEDVWLVVASKLADKGWCLRDLNKNFRCLIESSLETIDLCVRGGHDDLVIAGLVNRLKKLSTVTISPCSIGGNDYSVLATIIASIPGLTSLEVSHRHSFRGSWKLDLTCLSRLEYLVLPDGGMGLPPRADFRALPHLRVLGLNQNWDGCADDLCCLTQLTSLSLRNGSLQSVSALGSLTQLRSLNLTGQCHVKCFSALSRLTALTFLSLDFCTSLQSLDLLTSLSNLERLSCIAAAVPAPVFTSLSRLSNLDLSLASHLLPNLDSLACLTTLTKLWLDGVRDVHLTPLSTLQNLSFLSLRGNAILESCVDDLKTAIPSLLVVDMRTSIGCLDCGNCGHLSWSGMRE